MVRKYRPKIKGYVIPYIYVKEELQLILGMERLKSQSEYYCSLLGGTAKSKKSLLPCTTRELAEETGGYLQIEPEHLIEFDSYSDKDRITIYLLPLKNSQGLVYDINKFREEQGLASPECAENSFILTVGLDQLREWDRQTRYEYGADEKNGIESVHKPSSEAYHYFRKPYVNRYPLRSYKKFQRLSTDTSMRQSSLNIWVSDRLIKVVTALSNRTALLCRLHAEQGHCYTYQDLHLCDCRPK